MKLLRCDRGDSPAESAGWPMRDPGRSAADHLVRWSAEYQHFRRQSFIDPRLMSFLRRGIVGAAPASRPAWLVLHADRLTRAPSEGTGESW